MNISIPNFATARILVIGDVMLDSYVYGNAVRISPEAPVPIIHIQNSEERAGGAANVAINISTLGAKVKLLGLVGDDMEAQRLEKKLIASCVEFNLQRVPNVPTINKLRVVGRNQQLLRLDFEEKFSPSDDKMKEPMQRLMEEYEKYLQDIDLVILSDYGKGTLSNSKSLIKLAQSHKKPVLVDPKSKDFDNYRNATIITPNFDEFQAVVGLCQNENDIVKKAEKLRKNHNIQSILVTRGENGMSLIDDKKHLHLPTKAREIYDVTGAGDTVIATLGACLASGSSIDNAVMIANTAAGIVVGKLGAATVSPKELKLSLSGQEETLTLGILQEEELLLEIVKAKKNGDKIVMTNGCFDIIHAGHISYLTKAKELGTKLIVAVNNDASVKKLKGKKRPINNLSLRMSVLEALRCVDWVVSFAENTPERLIKKIEPNVLVKGNDYKIHEIAGADFVLKSGGEVVTIPLVEGLSTTYLIEKS